MMTMKITLDEEVARNISEKALALGTTPETWAAEVLAKESSASGSRSWIKKFIASADRNVGNSGGWKWNRDEIYDR